MAKSVQQALLERAFTLAGGVSYLARKLGIGVNSLDAMLKGDEPIPTWVFMRAVDIVNEAEDSGEPPPGFPADWQERLRNDSTKQ